jgi:uncharacterized OB-fold protein
MTSRSSGSLKNKVPLIEGLFTWPSDDPRIIAGKCTKCGTVTFPRSVMCPNPDCEKDRENIEEIRLSKRGKLYNYTYQIYSPPPPFRKEPFEPYGIAMVDFPEGLRMIGMVTRAENLTIGMEVEMTVGRLYEDEENEYLTWMWDPID